MSTLDDKGRSVPDAVHATAVAIDGAAILIAGQSGAGKSLLAWALVTRPAPGNDIRLLGDDRVLLSREGPFVVARPHPRIAGFIEHRGFGFVALRSLPWAPVAGVVTLRRDAVIPPLLRNIPELDLVREEEPGRRRAAVLDWWRVVRDLRTTPPREIRSSALQAAED